MLPVQRLCVQGLLSSQAVPAVVSHLPLSLQTLAVLQLLPSSQSLPMLIGLFVQPLPLESHLSSVHTSLSLQLAVAPPLHEPSMHVSESVQGSPSLHGPSAGSLLQPLVGS